MTAVVSRERARGAYLTGAAGALLIAIAALMMIVAAPGPAGHARSGLAKPSAVRTDDLTTGQPTTDVCHRLTSRSDSAVVRACLAGPPAASAQADA